MRRWVCIGATLALAVAVASCGDDDEAGETATTETTEMTETTVAIPSVAELEGMLLTADDIEAAFGSDPSWTAEALAGEESLSGYLQPPCDEVVLDAALVERLTADVAVDAGRDDLSANLLEFLITGEADQLSADLEAWSSAEESCAAVPPTSDDTSREIALPALGDERFAEVGTCEGWEPGSQYVALLRVGTVAVLIWTCQGSEMLISEDAFVQLVETAVTKVGG